MVSLPKDFNESVIQRSRKEGIMIKSMSGNSNLKNNTYKHKVVRNQKLNEKRETCNTCPNISKSEINIKKN